MLPFCYFGCYTATITARPLLLRATTEEGNRFASSRAGAADETRLGSRVATPKSRLSRPAGLSRKSAALRRGRRRVLGRSQWARVEGERDDARRAASDGRSDEGASSSRNYLRFPTEKEEERKRGYAKRREDQQHLGRRRVMHLVERVTTNLQERARPGDPTPEDKFWACSSSLNNPSDLPLQIYRER